MAIIPFHKQAGETLAQLLIRFRNEFPVFQESKITYAGRLDPLASGVMLLLTDEDVHRKESLLGLDKIYEVSFFCGVQTDSYDVLGTITDTQEISLNPISEHDVHKAIVDLQSLTSQSYPPYSSRTVKGKPLWRWAREGKIDSIEIPQKPITIFSVEFLGSEELSSQDLANRVEKAIARVDGDFRQKEIVIGWQNYFAGREGNETTYIMRIHASGGTYMRGLVDTLGKELGVGATTLSIVRTNLGKYEVY